VASGPRHGAQHASPTVSRLEEGVCGLLGSFVCRWLLLWLRVWLDLRPQPGPIPVLRARCGALLTAFPFRCVWDDRSGMYGDRRPYVLHFYLEDDTLEISEVYTGRRGRRAVQKAVGKWRQGNAANARVSARGLRRVAAVVIYGDPAGARWGFLSLFLRHRSLLPSPPSLCWPNCCAAPRSTNVIVGETPSQCSCAAGRCRAKSRAACR
jgi:hypothetical protein